MTTLRARRERARRRRERRQGMVMFVVMSVLLSSSAVAGLTLDSSLGELRSSGYSQQGNQVEAIAKAGLVASLGFIDSMGPTSLLWAMRQWQEACAADSSDCPQMNGWEPSLPSGALHYRIYAEDFSAPPLSRDSLGGYRQPYEPFFVTDVGDVRMATEELAGERSDGRRGMGFMTATLTTRGRIQSVSTDVTLSGDVRDLHELGNDVRAIVRTGPFQL